MGPVSGCARIGYEAAATPTAKLLEAGRTRMKSDGHSYVAKRARLKTLPVPELGRVSFARHFSARRVSQERAISCGSEPGGDDQ